MVSTKPIIRVEGLSKAYGKVQAVAGLSFTVQPGEIFGLLGPNGAGKSTTLSILQGLRRADQGQVSVLGLDVAEHPQAVKQRIGVQLQATSLLPDLSALEQVMLFARLYGSQMNRESALARLAQVGLADKATVIPSEMSGGQQQRLALALALVNDPEIVFLDEPTAGLDPQSRQRLWELVRSLRAQGRTVLLTTHYMEEAEALCDRVGIIDHGRLLALDTPKALINGLRGLSSITIALPLAKEVLRELPGVQSVQDEGEMLRLQTDNIPVTIAALLDLVKQHDLPLHDLYVRQPNLEEVFLTLTGRNIR